VKIDLQTKTITLAEKPKRVKKITGTRLAPILGLSPWSTEFEVWCDMTGVYKKPFEETIYTAAGKIIEPKVIAYLNRRYAFGKLRTPAEYFGGQKRYEWDHFPDDPIFGGLWDARTPTAIWELKTTKRVEDWYKGGQLTPPEYYKLQGALYAYLSGLDEFRMVLTILSEKDYEAPDKFEPSPENTIVKKYSVAAEYPNFAAHLNRALEWYERHINGLVSPSWDDKKDKEIIQALTTVHVPQPAADEEGDIVAELIRRIEPLQAEIEAAEEKIAEKVKVHKQLKEQLKAELVGRMKDSDKKITAKGQFYFVEVSKKTASGIDTDRLKQDGLYDKYKKNGFTAEIKIKRSDAV
jgi:hypothetical protein